MNYKLQITNYKFLFIIYLAGGFLCPVNAFAVEDKKEFAVVAAVEPLGLDHIIKEGDVKVTHIKYRDDRDMTELRDVIGRKVKRPIGANNVIKKDYLQEGVSMAVKKGDTVILIAEKDNVRVSTKGKLKEDGGLGSVVRVENISSGKILSGKIIEPGIVKIDF
ncbi:MAG: flagellar basal body P-ring formation protein FlgA [Deltaproteobacteria bacterium]|nr:flagellar basal body P-ring formation protein FlgA [Deltaproteobacteria bacterium]